MRRVGWWWVLAMAVLVSGVVRGAGDEAAAGKGQVVDGRRKAKALELMEKAGLNDAEDATDERIRAYAGVVAAGVDDEEMLKRAVEDEPDGLLRIRIYEAASQEQRARGNLAGAKRSAAAAAALLAKADGADPEWKRPGVVNRDLVAEACAETQAAGGDVPGALETLASIKGKQERAQAYHALWQTAEAQDKAAAKGYLAKAEEETLSDPGRTDMDKALLEEWEVEAGNAAEAEKLVGHPDTAMEAYEVAVLAELLAERGQRADAERFIALALQALDEKPANPADASNRVSTYVNVGEAYGELGDRKSAQAMVDKANALLETKSKELGARDLMAVAIAQDRVGEAQGAEQALQGMWAVAVSPQDEHGTRALWEWGRELADAGNTGTAEQFVEQALSGKRLGTGETARYAPEIAEDLALSDGADAKLGWIERVGEDGTSVERRAAYAGAACGMVESGANPKVRRYEAMAAVGDADAMARLGDMYDGGLGVTHDAQRAVEWYQKGDAAGSLQASAFLALMYEGGEGVPRDLQKAFELCKKAAEGGYVQAYASLGSAYQNGQGTPVDEAKALAWIKKGADAGDPFGLYLLGQRYRSGKGVEKDLKKAMDSFQEAVGKGSVLAMLEIADMYATGDGVGKDVAAARTWYRKAAADGDKDAEDWLKAHPE